MTSPGRRAHIKRAKTLRKACSIDAGRGSDAGVWLFEFRHWPPAITITNSTFFRRLRLANAIRAAYRR